MDIAKKIDHTMLKADAGKDSILRYCEEAKAHGFASVCVNTSYVPLVAKCGGLSFGSNVYKGEGF